MWGKSVSQDVFKTAQMVYNQAQEISCAFLSHPQQYFHTEVPRLHRWQFSSAWTFSSGKFDSRRNEGCLLRFCLAFQLIRRQNHLSFLLFQFQWLAHEVTCWAVELPVSSHKYFSSFILSKCDLYSCTFAANAIILWGMIARRVHSLAYCSFIQPYMCV